MPTLVRWFIKSSLVWFVLAMLMGVAVVARAVLDLPRRSGRSRPPTCTC
ncbi:MAG: hypothetical protein M5R40_27145 [Anaerolineae bacterium]|nr:hypothetical protein [Anaerolineae bacterium]